MDSLPNVILRGGPGDGRLDHASAPGDRLPFEDVGGGSITYVDSGRTEEHDGVLLRVYVPRS
ncbi:hypothetical protein GCM10023339_34410 [Alloalcanivorax gelatiniphagus]